MNFSNTAVASKTTSLSPVKIYPPSLLLRPVADVDEIVGAWNKYTELKSKLLSPSDYQPISGKQYIKKSGWRKLQTAFGISDEIINEKRTEFGKYFTYEVTAKVSTQNGRFAFGVGSCSSSERNFAHPEHDVRSTGHTRAKNRAISDLIGGGEVSADEMESSTFDKALNNSSGVGDWKSDVTSNTYSTNEKSRSWENKNDECITKNQLTLLRNLILEKVTDEDQREDELASLSDLNKSLASVRIQELINTIC